MYLLFLQFDLYLIYTILLEYIKGDFSRIIYSKLLDDLVLKEILKQTFIIIELCCCVFTCTVNLI